MTTSTPSPSPALAESLLVKPHSTNTGEDIRITIHNLMDAHNRLVYSLFPGPYAPLKVPSVALRAHTVGKSLTTVELHNLAILLSRWGWYCRCVVPSRTSNQVIVLCTECKKPVIEEED